MSYEEKKIVKGIFFMSSMRCQENVEQMAMQIKVQCAKQNIFVKDVVVEHNLIGNMDIDRPGVKAMVNGMVNRDCEVLVLRNQYDVTDNESDWGNFLENLADMGVQVYLIDSDKLIHNAYGNE